MMKSIHPLIRFNIILFMTFVIVFSLSGDLYSDTVRHTIWTGPYEIVQTAEGHEILAENFGRMRVPGKPILPYRIFAFAIPPGAEVKSVEVDGGKSVVLEGDYLIPPASGGRPMRYEDPEQQKQRLAHWKKNHDAVYKSDAVFPDRAGKFLRTAGFRKYRLVDVAVTPFRYHPLSGRLAYHPLIRVTVNYDLPEDWEKKRILDYSPRMEKLAEEFIYNYWQAQAWYPPPETMRSRESKDFIIVTTNALAGATTNLFLWEIEKGRSPDVYTVEWISSNYTGVDLAERIRNFLRDKYPTSAWGIEDVLFVGHHTSVPMREISQDYGYGKPETDFYFAELSNSDALSWDSNQNGLYGDNADLVDYYTEINVGRIPWSDYTTAQQICQKSIAFEQNNDPAFKKNILLLGAYFWADTDCAILMETKVDQPWMHDWSMIRMYEKNVNYYSPYPCDYELLRSNAVNVWSNGSFAFVNYAGHGSPTSSHIYGLGAPAFIQSSDCSSLSNSYPAIVFADACSNNDVDYNNIGREMLKRGAVGFVGSTKVADGQPAWNHPLDGSSQTLDYYFTINMTSGRSTQGAAHQWGLRTLYQYGLWDAPLYEMAEWTLWGNPDLKLGGVPVLNSGSVTPAVGYYGKRFTFTIQYYEAYGEPPASIYVNIDGTDHAMTLESGDASDGIYKFSTRDIAAGAAHGYYFHAEDGGAAPARYPASGTLTGPATYDPDLALMGTPAAGDWMDVEVWGCSNALWGSAWSSEPGPYYLPVTGLVFDIGPGDLHMAKKVGEEPLHLDAFGYGIKGFKIPGGTAPGFKFIQGATKMNAYWAKTNRETFQIP